MSVRTVEAYVAAVSSLAQHYHRSPDRITDEELQAYLLHLREERHLAPSSLNQHVSALRRFYDLVLQRPTESLDRVLPQVRGQTRRPQVFSRAELERLFTIGCPEPKARAFLMTVYGAGLRLSEACHLKVEHDDLPPCPRGASGPNPGTAPTTEPPAPAGDRSGRSLKPEGHRWPRPRSRLRAWRR